MPFSRPTLNELDRQAGADIDGRLPGADSRLRRSVLGVLARALAGAVHGLHGFLAFLARQIFPDSAEAEFLARWASIWGVARGPAQPAAGEVTFAGGDGAVIPAGTVLLRGDGAEYEVVDGAAIADGTATAEVTAREPGEAGNALAGTTLTLASPIAGVQSTAAVAAGGLVQGSDEEDDASLLARLLLRIQQPPHGGAGHDYPAWALDRAGHGVAVTRAWVYPQELGAGTVTVRFMMDDTYPDGIPEAADVAAVQAFIDEERPVTAAVTVVAPVPVALDFEITALDPDTPAVRAAVEANLRDLVRREAEPGGAILISHIREAISTAPGERDHVLTTPAADVTHGAGEIAVFGAVTWD